MAMSVWCKGEEHGAGGMLGALRRWDVGHMRKDMARLEVDMRGNTSMGEKMSVIEFGLRSLIPIAST